MSGAADPVSEAGYLIRRPPHSTARFLLSGRFFQGQIGDQLLERRRLATQAYDLSRGSSPGLNHPPGEGSANALRVVRNGEYFSPDHIYLRRWA